MSSAYPERQFVKTIEREALANVIGGVRIFISDWNQGVIDITEPAAQRIDYVVQIDVDQVYEPRYSIPFE